MGAINLKHTGSGSSITLSSDGTSLLLDGTAVGGLELYADNPSTPTTPIATGANDVAIGTQAEATGGAALALGFDAVASGNLSLAINAGTASNTASIAIGQQAVASGSSSLALGYGTDATGGFSTAVGRNAQATSTSSNAFGRDAVSAGNQSTAIGDAYASGADSFAAAIANNTSTYGATGTNSVAIGYRAKASANYSLALGENTIASNTSNTAIGPNSRAYNGSGVAIGDGAEAQGHTSTSIGSATYSGGNNSFALGLQSKTNERGKFAYASGQFSAKGDAQGGTFILRSDTTDATAEALTTNNSTAASTNQIVAANDTCITFSGTVVAMQNGAQSYGSWEVRGLLVNDGGTTTLPVFNISEIGSSGWKVNLYADNTNNALKVQVTGVAATNIRWVAHIATSEVTYA